MSAKLRILVATAVAVTVLVPSAVLALTNWDAEVEDIGDGDTFTANVDYEGDGSFNTSADVRMTGIQAMELDKDGYAEPDFKGPCMGPKAATRLLRLIEGEQVVLSAQFPDSAGSHNRPKRFVSFDVDGDGDREDVGRLMIREGLALWSSSPDEWTKNLDYYKAAKAAQGDKVGLWNPTYGGDRCSPASAAERKIDM